MSAVDNFRNNLRALVDEKKVKIVDMSNATGIARTTIYAYKDDGDVPRLDKVELIAAFLRLTISDLCGSEVPVLPAKERNIEEDRLAAIRAILAAKDSSVSVLLDLMETRGMIGDKGKKTSDLS